jgi:hypothetical protein
MGTYLSVDLGGIVDCGHCCGYVVDLCSCGLRAAMNGRIQEKGMKGTTTRASYILVRASGRCSWQCRHNLRSASARK